MLMAIIKKRLKPMSVSTQFYSFCSLFIFEQIRNQPINDAAYNPDEREHDNRLNLFN